MITYADLHNRKCLIDGFNSNIHLCILLLMSSSYFISFYPHLLVIWFSQAMCVSNLLKYHFPFYNLPEHHWICCRLHFIPIILYLWKWLQTITWDWERKACDASFTFGVTLSVFSNWLLMSYFPGPGTP